MLESTQQMNENTRNIWRVFHQQKKHALNLRYSTSKESLAKLKKLKQAVLSNYRRFRREVLKILP